MAETTCNLHQMFCFPPQEKKHLNVFKTPPHLNHSLIFNISGSQSARTAWRACYKILRTLPRSTIYSAGHRVRESIMNEPYREAGTQLGGNPDLCSCYEICDLKISTNHVISLFQTFCL